MNFTADFSKKKPNTLIIVGNGFDVANNFKTKYSDFYQSSYFKNLCDNSNLAKYIRKQNERLNWSDLECLLAKYSEHLVNSYNGKIPQNINDNFEMEFLSLRKALYDYICTVQDSSVSNPYLEDLIEEWMGDLVINNKAAYILSFNYITCDYRFFSKNEYLQQFFIGGNPNQVHGVSSYKHNCSVYDCPIVLGVDESNIKCKEHKFLIKEFDKNTNISGYFESIEVVDKIIIFGCSLGMSDFRFFKPLFNQKGKKFEIYCYDDEGLSNIKNAISKFVDYTKFSVCNSVEFYDSSKKDFPLF